MEKMEDLCKSVKSWGIEKYYIMPFPDWKGVDEYRDPVDPTLLSSNSASVFMEVKRLLHSCVERTVILTVINQDTNKVLGDESNETVKLHRLESIT